MASGRETAGARFWKALPLCAALVGLPLLIALLTARTDAPAWSLRVALLIALGAAAALVASLAHARAWTRLDPARAAREAELVEALAQEAATDEILRAMVGAAGEVQPVLDAIARNAVRVCDGKYAAVHRFDGELIHLSAHHNLSAAGLEALQRVFPCPPGDSSVTARAVRDGRVIHLPDVPRDPDVPAATREISRAWGWNSLVVVPMLQDGRPLGTINVGRVDAPFTERQIQRLGTFAAQAVLAIEDARLFGELQARNRELTESLDQQTATGAILRVISGSPTDIQPVLDAVAESATRLCDARDVSIALVDGDVLRVAASHGMLARWWPDEGVPISRGSVTGRAVVDRRTVHIHDLASESDAEFPQGKVYQRLGGHRTYLAVPLLLREGVAIGVIAMRRGEVRPFTDQQVRLLETFADQAVIAIENVRLFQELEARNRALTEALEQQTATGEILGVISSSPTDVQPVFEAIVRSAVPLCEAVNGAVHRFDGSLIHLVAQHGMTPEALDVNRRLFPRPPGRGSTVARAILIRDVVHIDIAVDAEYELRGMVEAGFRTVLSVPMFRDGNPIGVITVTREEGRPFTEQQIALLRTFADQAVIAIENVRLFQELQERNRALTEALEQQTATAEILRAISRSPTDVQPVFDAIVVSALRLCDGQYSGVYRVEGDLLHLAAHSAVGPEDAVRLRQAYPRPLGREQLVDRVILDRTVAHVSDMEVDPTVPAWSRERARLFGYRSFLAVPMVRGEAVIGAIRVNRIEPTPFSDSQIALLQTFADQAVIAIENVRLFQELQERNRALTESLEQQTATGEILRVISSSPTDLQPVFDTIAAKALDLCRATTGWVYRFDGELIHVAAACGLSAEGIEVRRQSYPMPPSRGGATSRAVLSQTMVYIPNILEDDEYTLRTLAEAASYLSVLAVPMLREGKPIGVITVTGAEAGAFSQSQIELLKIFADQAVIAIENVRLFQELETRTRALARSVEELQALSEVGRAVSSTLDLPTVLATIVARAVQLSGTSGGVIYEYDEATQEFHLRASHRAEEALVEALQATPVRLGMGATGQAALRRAPVEVVDILDDQQYRVPPVMRATLNQLGYRSVLGVPLLVEQRILGALTVWRREPGSFPPDTVKLLQTFATQSVLAIQNARLFREIEAKSRELEVASRHKGQFLANMSHELRTPLNAVLGYTELVLDGIYGEVPAKVLEVMARIDQSGRHLLGLINDVLDLSKIEAGQLVLALADYSLREVVHAVVTQVESLAAEKGLALRATVVPDLPAGRGDERRLTQVLLNLVGNALKFTEAGEVRIDARHRDGAFVVAVADTGPGIAEADRERIFQEFQQADSSSTRRKGGTGLGLSIARRIVELHGGRLGVESVAGRGSTFTFTVPVRAEGPVARA